jgi:hypothetical protein
MADRPLAARRALAAAALRKRAARDTTIRFVESTTAGKLPPRAIGKPIASPFDGAGAVRPQHEDPQMSKKIIEQYDEDELDNAVTPSADQFRRPLRHGEVVPPIPSIYEQLAKAAMTPLRPAKVASR